MKSFGLRAEKCKVNRSQSDFLGTAFQMNIIFIGFYAVKCRVTGISCGVSEPNRFFRDKMSPRHCTLREASRANHANIYVRNLACKSRTYIVMTE